MELVHHALKGDTLLTGEVDGKQVHHPHHFDRALHEGVVAVPQVGLVGFGTVDFLGVPNVIGGGIEDRHSAFLAAAENGGPALRFAGEDENGGGSEKEQQNEQAKYEDEQIGRHELRVPDRV